MSCSVGVYASSSVEVLPDAVVDLRAHFPDSLRYTSSPIIASWYSIAPATISAQAKIVGTGPSPVLVPSDATNPFPYVRLNNTITASNGGYFDFGSLTLPIHKTGVIILGCFRFPAYGSYSRLFDFGKNTGGDNLLAYIFSGTLTFDVRDSSTGGGRGSVYTASIQTEGRKDFPLAVNPDVVHIRGVLGPHGKKKSEPSSTGPNIRARWLPKPPSGQVCRLGDACDNGPKLACYVPWSFLCGK